MDNIIGAANWYCDQTSQFHRFENVTLPVLDREMTQHVIGRFGLELPDEIKALSCEMGVKGSPGDLRSRFGRDAGDWSDLRYYEKLMNIFPTGQAASGPQLKGRIVFLKGLLQTYTPPGVSPSKAEGATKLRWSSIVLYHDIVDGQTIHKFDLQNNILIINGVNYTAENNRLIAV